MQHNATHQNMSLGTNGVDLMRSLRKIPTWLRGTNFCINCTSSQCFAPSFMQLRNDPKCTQHYATHQNMSLRSNGADWVRSLWKIPMWLLGTTPYAPKYFDTDRNISFGSNGVDWICSLRKIPTWLRGTNFCINCTSSPCFASSFMQLRNDPKCTQTLWNTPKHEFRVQWGRSGALVAKNYNVTSWHELLH